MYYLISISISSSSLVYIYWCNNVYACWCEHYMSIYAYGICIYLCMYKCECEVGLSIQVYLGIGSVYVCMYMDGCVYSSIKRIAKGY